MGDGSGVRWAYPFSASRGMGRLAQRCANLRAEVDLEPLDWAGSLATAIREQRRCGKILLGAWRPSPTGPERPSATTLVDRAAVELDLCPLGSAWLSVGPPEAERVFRRLLEQDMAYDSKVLAPEPALALARRFFEPFSSGPACLSSATWTERRVDGWSPVGTATFETALAVVSPEGVGLFYVGDED